MMPYVSFFGKAESKSIPGVAALCEVLDQIMFKRDKKLSKEAAEQIVDVIMERQLQAEQQLRPPIVIFPEGGTTNGEYVVKFNRGAFASLRAVKPFAEKMWSLTGI